MKYKRKVLCMEGQWDGVTRNSFASFSRDMIRRAASVKASGAQALVLSLTRL